METGAKIALVVIMIMLLSFSIMVDNGILLLSDNFVQYTDVVEGITRLTGFFALGYLLSSKRN